MFVVDKKKEEYKNEVMKECGCQIGCSSCAVRRRYIDMLSDSNIPCIYWNLKYSEFSGAITIKTATQNYAKSIRKNYANGLCIAYAGTPGTGKTFSACTILKTALATGYSAYYTTLTDMAHYLTDFSYRDKFYHKISRVDVLCIDEVDSRHFAESDASSGFFGRFFERIIRYRIQNKLPIIISTNNAKLEDAFSGQFKKIVESLASANTIIVPSLGLDYRLKVGRPKLA